MAAIPRLERINGIERIICESIEIERKSYKEVSETLQQQYPGLKGLSSRSVRRFCYRHNIHGTSRLLPDELSRVVSSAISQVGPTYGRKTFQGLLASQGIRAGQGQVGAVLPRVNPTYHPQRQTQTACPLNPIPYQASYFGHKLHVDQNEKLVMFGVTHICGIDGFSGMVVAFASMPVKNNIEIYKHVFRPSFIKYGIWDQIRIDHGLEWILSLYIQEMIAHWRTNTSRAPHLQTSSKLNHTVERYWVEINSRVNYPIKQTLIQMQDDGVINMDSPIHRFCISWFTLRVASAGTSLAIQAWNNHRIPGRKRGVPNELMRKNNRAAKVPKALIPTPEEAVDAYHETGGHLTLLPKFGSDPLDGYIDLQDARNQGFTSRYPQFEPIFSAVVNNNSEPFKSGLLLYISLTTRLSFSIIIH